VERSGKIANDDIERQGVFIHYARLQINAGRFDEAQKNLEKITEPLHEVVKNRLVRKLAEERKKAEADRPPVKSDGAKGEAGSEKK